MMSAHGTPCWYELTTDDGTLSAATEFYKHVLGWSVIDAQMPGFDYHIALAGDDMVAGLMVTPDDVSDMPSFWMLYISVDSADQTAKKIEDLGGKIFRQPEDIPNTGRFAIASDPQGVGFAILQPESMEDDEGGSAFDQQKPGHAAWHELMSPDWEAGFAFYHALFGWEKSEVIPMGDAGIYQLFSHGGLDIGGMMDKGGAPVGGWLTYFVVDGVEDAMKRIQTGGGSVLHGPQEVPGGSFVAVASDPNGANFAVTGPRKAG